ncbi:MAG TPA: hypothetical protein P5137_07975 [Candidatus Brocadiia bacterium]|nr:hypothetical protein [Candidatus Brocadiia bacterium]
MMLIEKRGLPIPQEVRNADTLTKDDLEACYPDAEEPVDGEEYREALSTAKTVLA